jgi:putative membrane protein
MAMHIGAVGLDDWALDPAMVVPLAIGGAIYIRGVWTLRRKSVRHAPRPWRVSMFAAGWVIAVLALISPLHFMAEQLFAAHMVQHELLMVLAAPLIVVGDPGVITLWAFPADARQQIARFMRATAVRRIWQALSRPMNAWLLHAVVIWAWHVPRLFEATLSSDLVHALQHASFFGSALLFWWAVVHGHRRAMRGLSIVYLFTTAVHTSVLGALMTFARSSWYPAYSTRAAAWGFTPLEDQQLAGLIMWIPPGFVYLVAALVVIVLWLRDSERSGLRALYVAR